MSVRQLKDGRMICEYRLEGKKKVKYFGRGLEAQKAAESFDADLKATGTIRNYKRHQIIEQGVTINELAREYLLQKSKTELTKTSVNALQYKLFNVILPEIGHLKAATLTHKRLDNYVEKRLGTPRLVRIGTKEKPLWKIMKNLDPAGRKKTVYIKKTTVHRELSDIQAILNWAVTKKYLVGNPVMGHKKPKKDNEILKPPSVKETLAILAESAPHLIRALKISFFTGLRPGAEELFRLTWPDVDLDERTIFIVSAKKNGPPSRTVPLHDELVKDLTAWQKEDKKKTVNTIITWNDKPIKSAKHAFSAAKRRAGITRRIRLYDFRHAAVSNMLGNNADLKSVSQIIGHSRTDTTTRIYQHTNMDLLKKSIATIPGLTTPGRTDKVIDLASAKKNRKENKTLQEKG